MAIAFGSDLPSNFKLGSSQVTKILLGQDLVWPVGATGDLPLDITGSADLAYSVRLLSSTYTGPCMRVKRSSDDTQIDIGFNALGNLNVGAIIDFVGSGIGTVTIWYDQSGNGFDVSGDGIKICEGGSIYYSTSGRPALRKDPSPSVGSLQYDGAIYPASLVNAGTFTNIEKYSQPIVTVPSNENLYWSTIFPEPFQGSFPYTISDPLSWRYSFRRTNFPFSVTLESGTLSLSTNYSFGAVMNAGGTSTLYQDGVSVDSNSTSAGSIDTAVPSDLIMGSVSSDSGSYFSEYIHYNRDCTSFVADLNANMLAYYKPAVTPVADFSGSPLSGTGPLEVTFTDLSTNTPTDWLWDFGDGATSGSQNPTHTFGSTGSTGDYTISLTASNAGGSDSEVKTNYIEVIIPPSTLLDSLQTYWKFDETSGTTATDEIASYVINHNGAAIVAGKINDGLSIQTGDFPTCTSNTPHTFSKSSPFSLSFWYRATAGGTRVIFDKQQTDATRRGYECYIVSDILYFNFFGNATSNFWGTNFGNAFPSTGVWYHALFTYDGSASPTGLNLYVNNTLQTRTVEANTLGAFDFNGTANFKFGVYFNDTLPMLGTGDELASWNRVLTTDERAELYNAGSGNAYPFS